MTTKKLRTRQADMKRRHQRIRPWEYTKLEEIAARRLNLIRAMSRGLSNDQIAASFRLSIRYVRWFREVEFVLWKVSVAKSLEDKKKGRKL
jgi:DNA-binding NarL/FixJ family response regulator